MTPGTPAPDLDVAWHQVGEGTQALAVRLDAPLRRNALTPAMVASLEQLLIDNPEVPLLLGSTTPGIFSAGADLGVDDQSRVQLSDRLYSCYELMIIRPGLVVAAVDGPAVGGGAQLASAADLRTASQQARWRWVGPGHGLAVGAWILPELVGRSRGLDLALTGRWLAAEEAVTSGLVAELAVDPWAAALSLLARLVTADPQAVARVKQVATRPQLLEQLREERRRNFAYWTGRAPSPQEAARAGRTPGVD